MAFGSGIYPNADFTEKSLYFGKETSSSAITHVDVTTNADNMFHKFERISSNLPKSQKA